MTFTQKLFRGLTRRAADAFRTRSIVMRNPRPVVSFTFDDCPATAVTTGAHLLEQRGVRGSFYLCGGLSEQVWENDLQFSPAQARGLAERGHEIGCHTFNHVSCHQASAADLRREIAANSAYFHTLLGRDALTTFAYPYGHVGLTAKRLLQRQFAACRGVSTGINSTVADLGLLKAVPLPHDTVDGPAAAARMAPWLARTRDSNGWLVLFTHDVTDRPTRFGCTPETLAATIDAVIEAGFDVLPLQDALNRAAFGHGDRRVEPPSRWHTPPAPAA
jgi:peptidoglycan/xylan/chitin deacetylase (PgdA/CDA1 family)